MFYPIVAYSIHRCIAPSVYFKSDGYGHLLPQFTVVHAYFTSFTLIE